MSIYKKLQNCRVKLQSTEMKKSGINTFSNYKYFELGDFLPSIQTLFDSEGLCGIISFDKDLATLTIHDYDSEATIVFTSPMADAALKGCHPIQNLGAVQTYQRRYLYMSALEIVEHDAIEPVTGKKDNLPEPKPKAEKKTICPDTKIAWDNAKAAFKRDGNLDKVLERVNITQENILKLYAECDSV